MKLNTWYDCAKDTEYKTGDILLIKNGKKLELAFIDSGLNHGAPSRISSIPEAWSYDFLDEMEDVLKKLKETKYGVILGTTRLRDYYGKYCFTLYKYMRVLENVLPYEEII